MAKVPASSDLLRALDTSLEGMFSKVSPAALQIIVSGYGPSEDHGHSDTARIVRQHGIGTRIIVDPDGYIMTNNALSWKVRNVLGFLPPPAVHSPLALQPIHAGQILEATLVGTHKQSGAESEDPSLGPLYEDSIRDTIKQFEAPGSPVGTDGEQRKYRNFAQWTGMGRRISRSIVESHGGPLWAGDALPCGATFTLPCPQHPRHTNEAFWCFHSIRGR
jgi:hypothetical protein